MKYGAWVRNGVLAIVAVMLLSGCGGSTVENSGDQGAAPAQEDTPAKEKAYYVDDPIMNVHFRCGSHEGSTDRNGTFFFEPGKGCSFFVASLKIRELDASLLKPEAYIIESDLKIATLLQSLDADGMQDDRIEIDEETLAYLRENNVTQLPETDAQRRELIAKINRERNATHALQVREREQALAHIRANTRRYLSHTHFFTAPLEGDDDNGSTSEENNTSTSDDANASLPDDTQPDDPNGTDNAENNASEENNTTSGTPAEDTNGSVDTPDENTTSPETNTSVETNTTTPEDNSTMPGDDNTSEEANSSAPDDGNTSEETNTTTPEDNSTMPGDNNTSEEANSSAPDDGNTSEENNTTTPEDNSTTPIDDNTSDESNSSEGTTTPSLIYTKLDDHLYLNEKKDVALYIADDLNKSEKLIYNYSYIQTVTNKLYEHFNDAYDFIFLVTNNDERPATVSYSGVFMKVKNDVEGIGAPIYSNTRTYGSAEKLKGVMHFAYRSAILRGPTLHEISHYWANKFNFDFNEAPYYRLGDSGHWSYLGFFGGKGQLGGYDANTLEQTKDTDGSDLTFTDSKNNLWKVYSAESFGWNANGAGRIPYNDLELYLMGMIPKSDVADIMVPAPYGSPLTPDAKEYIVNNGLEVSGRSYFMAQNMVRKSWEEIMSDHNISARNPSYDNAQKHFKVLTVLLDTQMPKPHEVNGISLQMAKFTLQGDDGNDLNHNFWEATRHLGTLSSDHLDDALKSTGSEYAIEDDYQEEEITFHGKSYKTIRSPYTGRVWLDRNIGADHVCTSFDDEGCYGEYFQFGRGYDGHQEKNSPTTETKKETLTPNDNAFVLIPSGTYAYDWVAAGVDDDKAQRVAMVRSTDGSGACPAGFRLPTYDEFYADTIDNIAWDSFPSDSVEGNFLKMPFAGYRNSQNAQGIIQDPGTMGAYWTSTISESSQLIRNVFFNQDTYMPYTTDYLANGETIRCIKAEQ